MNYVNRNKLTLRTNTQKALFLCELQGQLSDGMWENASPRNHWVDWCELKDANVEVGETLGRNFFPRRSTYGLTSKQMLDVIGDRMIIFAKLADVFTVQQIDFIETYLILNGKVDREGFLRRMTSNAHAINIAIKHFGKDNDYELTAKVVEMCLAKEYGMKELKADLREIKTAMETYLR